MVYFALANLSSRARIWAHQLFNMTCHGLSHIAKISISEYKHNPSKRPFNILLAREDVPSLCPVTALLQYTRLRGERSGPLFCNADFSPVSLHQFNTELQRCLTYCGLDLSRYKSHIFLHWWRLSCCRQWFF